MNNECKKMTSLKQLSEDVILSILDFLNYQDLFYRENSLLSKTINIATQKLLNFSKLNSEISDNFLSLYLSKKELANVPIILYCPNKSGYSLKTRLFNIFESKPPHQELFISNIFTKKLSFMIKPLEDQILFVDFLENKLNYNVYTRPKKYSKLQILY